MKPQSCRLALFRLSFLWVALIGINGGFFGKPTPALAAGAAPKKGIEEKPSEKQVSQRLSNLLKDQKLLGLNFESPDLRSASDREVQQYLQFRDQTLPPDQALALRTECTQGSGSRRGSEGQNPLCPLVRDPEFGKRYEVDPEIRKEKKLKSKKLLQSVKKGDLKAVLLLSQSMSEAELSQSFRSTRKIRVIARLAERMLKKDTCLNSTNRLLVALGLRMENEFPSPKYRTLAESLYRKAFASGQDQSSVAAGYRLGLFQIWAHHCDKAEEILSQIPESPLAVNPIDYRMRIDFWRAQCALEMGAGTGTGMEGRNPSDSSPTPSSTAAAAAAFPAPLPTTLKEKLVHNYPLSLHTLLLAPDSPIREAQLASPLDPAVSLRPNSSDPAVRAHLSRVARDAEALLSRGEREIAAILLRSVPFSTLAPEIPFQLYWVVLLQRAGDMATSFRVISDVFRQDPTIISKSTLELLYPKVDFDPIQKAVAGSQADPYLILSLIRQESAFDSRAKSSADAQGLMQLEWSTARRFERVSESQLWDPETNLRVGVKVLKRLESRFEGRLDQALAAYNAGPERIREWSKRYTTSNPLLFLDLLPLQETRDYVAAIARNYYWYKRLYSKEGLSQGSKEHSSREDGQKLLELLGYKQP